MYSAAPEVWARASILAIGSPTGYMEALVLKSWLPEDTGLFNLGPPLLCFGESFSGGQILKMYCNNNKKNNKNKTTKEAEKNRKKNEN